ncbi:EAL domain-containing protein [Neptunomonas concharum]|uniref:EAL domain-containing protein n=1 Tax=Neptunomonas concharum TaxID=1031538 RepID=A0A5P1R6M9_9GAMM|nr:EAL domain-containing protein [Neptunomonas concharum]QEQ95369.1 EAL domain-containing protein [Neptunomonas concharum]
MNISISWSTVNRYLVTLLISGTLTTLVFCSFYVEHFTNEKELRRESLLNKATNIADWLDQNFSAINLVLLELESTQSSCSEDSLFQIRSALFTLPQIVEIGFVDHHGTLLCTSWEKIRPQIKVAKPEKVFGLRFLGPLIVEFMQQPAFVLARTTSDFGEVNALLRISWLQNQLLGYTSTHGYTAIIDNTSGVPITLEGEYSLPLRSALIHFPLSSSTIREGTFDNGKEHVVAIRPLLTLPNLSIAISERSDILYRGVDEIPMAWYSSAFGLFLLLYLLSWQVQRYLINPTQQLKKAVYNKEFFSVFQPLVDSKTRCLIGVEALVRWQHPTDGIKPPAMFLPHAEQSGLLKKMTSQQLEQCRRDLAPFIEECPQFTVHINIAACHLLDKDCLNELISFRETIPGLVLEVTENSMLALDSDKIQQALKRLDAANIPIAIDDFGTGYCGLSYLRSLPVSILKADKSFISSMSTDSVNADVLHTILKLAKTLNLTTVAEGVETQQQWQQLTEMDVDIQQGWLHGRPMTAEALQTLFTLGGQRRSQ